MKKILSTIGVAALLAITTNAQTTNSDIIGDVGTVLNDIGISGNPTNYAFATFVGRSLKGNQTAWGLLAVENVNQNVGICIGYDHLWGGGLEGSANIVAGGITLKAATHPLGFLTSNTNSWLKTVTATPYAVALTGTPVSGTGNANGGLAAMARAGFVIDIYNFNGWKLAIGGDYGNRTGSGNYNGNWIDGVLTVRKGF